MNNKRKLSAYEANMKRDLGNARTQLQRYKNMYNDVKHDYDVLQQRSTSRVVNVPVKRDNGKKRLILVLVTVVMVLVIVIMTCLKIIFNIYGT